MAGNAAAGSPPEPKKPYVKTFSCTNCGASVTVKYPGESIAVACDSCHSTIDITDPNYKILSYYLNKQTYKPRIEIGSRGKLFGRLWEVTGFVVRCDHRTRYAWEEYLLFNPYYGYRWLALAEGHWNFVESIKRIPDVSSFSRPNVRGSQASLEGRRYKIFYSGLAETLYVFGEFYWRIAVGDCVDMADYIDPPNMLSREGDKAEVVWSQSTYVEPKEISRAFGKNVSLPTRSGIGPNQPTVWSTVWKHTTTSWAIFLLALTAIQFYHITTSPNLTVLEIPYSFPSNKKRPDITTPVFDVKTELQNLKIIFKAQVDNSWFWVGGELVNDKTGESYPFERSVEYYHGVDGGESWSEGGTQQDVLISRLPAGRYYINMDTESGGFKDLTPHSFTVIVKRGVTTFSNYIWALIFISLFPTLAWLIQRSEEVTRWSQSDFSPFDVQG